MINGYELSGMLLGIPVSFHIGTMFVSVTVRSASLAATLGPGFFYSALQRWLSLQRCRHASIHAPLATLHPPCFLLSRKRISFGETKVPLASRFGAVCRIDDGQGGLLYGQRCVRKGVRICSFGTEVQAVDVFFIADHDSVLCATCTMYTKKISRPNENQLLRRCARERSERRVMKKQKTLKKATGPCFGLSIHMKHQ